MTKRLTDLEHLTNYAQSWYLRKSPLGRIARESATTFRRLPWKEEYEDSPVSEFWAEWRQELAVLTSTLTRQWKGATVSLTYSQADMMLECLLKEWLTTTGIMHINEKAQLEPVEACDIWEDSWMCQSPFPRTDWLATKAFLGARMFHDRKCRTTSRFCDPDDLSGSDYFVDEYSSPEECGEEA